MVLAFFLSAAAHAEVALVDVLSAVYHSPLATTAQKNFANSYALDNISQDMGKAFECKAAADGSTSCRVGFSDYVRERAYTHYFGIEVKLTNDNDGVKVLSVTDYNFDENENGGSDREPC